MLLNWLWISRCGDYWQQAELRTDGACRIHVRVFVGVSHTLPNHTHSWSLRVVCIWHYLCTVWWNITFGIIRQIEIDPGVWRTCANICHYWLNRNRFTVFFVACMQCSLVVYRLNCWLLKNEKQNIKKLKLSQLVVQSMIKEHGSCWSRIMPNLTYKVVHGLLSGYLGPFTRVTDLPSRRSLRSIGINRLVVPISRLLTTTNMVAELFRSPVCRHGMNSRKTWHQQNHWPHFVASSRHTCSGSLFLSTCWTYTDCLQWT